MRAAGLRARVGGAAAGRCAAALRRLTRGGAIGALLAALAFARPARAADYSLHAEIVPPVTSIGARVTYRGSVLVPHGEAVQWVIPHTEGDFTWGHPVTRRSAAPGGLDTILVEAPLQVFALGEADVPGMRLLLKMGSQSAPSEHSLPVAHVVVIGQIAPHDTSADLRPMRGPVPAPWWERVPWTITAIALAVLFLIVALLAWLRTRRRKPVIAAPVPRPVAPKRDPIADALAELAALRRLQLPEAGRFADHAFQLTRIVRRLLEATAGGIRPGYTTSELVASLAGGSARVDLPQLEGMLRLWDFLKFARGASTLEEAKRTENGVEALIRAAAPAPRREVA
jgi:hypothetical protein